MLPSIKIESEFPKAVRTYLLPWEQGTLLTMLNRIQPRRMLECGVNEGRTAAAVLKWIESIEYYCGVDVPFGTKMPLPGQQSEVPQEAGHMAKSDKRFEVILRATGNEDALIADRGPFDVVFIDGDHSRLGVLTDYGLARRVLRRNGWIFFHDYGNATVEVTAVLDDMRANGQNVVHIEGTMLAYEQL